MLRKSFVRDAVLVIAASIALAHAMHTVALAQAQTQATTTSPTVTLYSILAHRGEQRDFCLSFKSGSLAPWTGRCNLRYGGWYMGEYLDWFESPLVPDNRSVIKDLGAHTWTGQFKVPVVKPLPKLKPGEVRLLAIGKPSATFPTSTAGDASDPGTDDLRTRNINVGRRVTSTRDFGEVIVPSPRTDPPKPGERTKRQSLVKGPPLVKAVAGHMYLIHVVDDTNDFYALFRVDELQRGDNCTISWKLIPAPVSKR